MSDAIIEAYTGNVGSGKTYHAVMRAYAHLLAGGHVYGNVKLNKEAIELAAAADGYEIDFDKQVHHLENSQIAKYPRHITAGDGDLNVLLLVDEAHLYFNARNWKETSEEILTMNTQTRKLFVHIICLTQHIDNLDSQFRRLLQFDWFHVDLAKVYFPVLRFQLGIPITQRVCFDPQNRKVKHGVWHEMRSGKFYKMYVSTALLVDIAVGKSLGRIKPRKLAWRIVWRAKLQMLGLSPRVAAWWVN